MKAEKGNRMKILLAIDGSECSADAVAEVARIPWPSGTEVRVVTADPPPEAAMLNEGATSVFDEIVKKQQAEATRHLAAAVDILFKQAPGLRVIPLLLSGRPVDAILAEAERCEANMIVVGSHGYGPIKRFFLGSVSQAVAKNAHCSVLIVRCTEKCKTPEA